jgi:hypothetical protein
VLILTSYIPLDTPTSNLDISFKMNSIYFNEMERIIFFQEYLISKKFLQRERKSGCDEGGRLHATILPVMVSASPYRVRVVFLSLLGVNQWRLGVSQPLELWSFVSARA